ncbi:MAG: hypothetical protein ACJ72N_23235 [Labedaea sp.]
MPARTRLLTWLAGVALVAGAVVLLRATDDPSGGRTAPASTSDPISPPVRVRQFAADSVVAPRPGEPPGSPTGLVALPGPERLRLSWSPAAGVAGYEVRWSAAGEPDRTRLVIAPDTQLDQLTDGRPYRIEVRGVDGFGRRSRAAAAVAVAGRADDSWRTGLTGLFDDFADPNSVLGQSSGSRWHLSGYRGCVDLSHGSTAEPGLPIDLGCGADLAVLRARQPMRLAEPGPDGVLGRVALLTDTAGPGGELTVDLVPGPADRVGTGTGRAATGAGVDPTLPGGTLRAVVNDLGASVRAGAGVPAVVTPAIPGPAPRRGPGVLHRFDVLLTTAGMLVMQDGTLIASGGVLPPWREAFVLLGFRGPDGHRVRVHLAAAGFSGPAASVLPVVEVPVNPGTQRVLGPVAPAPGIGIARTPLVAAAAARVVATITSAAGLDVNAVQVQLGDRVVAARRATTSPPDSPGAVLTVLADVPSDLLGESGPVALTPFVVRAAGAGDGATVVESYLEITPGPSWSPGQLTPHDTDPRRPASDALPAVQLTMGNAGGAPLPDATVPPRGQLVLTVALDASVAQWDSGGVAGVQGFELWLDGRLAAGVPTAADGPGLGGSYAVSLALTAVTQGPHVLEVRELGSDPATRPVSLLRNFVVR